MLRSKENKAKTTKINREVYLEKRRDKNRSEYRTAQIKTRWENNLPKKKKHRGRHRKKYPFKRR